MLICLKDRGILGLHDLRIVPLKLGWRKYIARSLGCGFLKEINCINHTRWPPPAPKFSASYLLPNDSQISRSVISFPNRSAITISSLPAPRNSSLLADTRCHSITHEHRLRIHSSRPNLHVPASCNPHNQVQAGHDGGSSHQARANLRHPPWKVRHASQFFFPYPHLAMDFQFRCDVKVHTYRLGIDLIL
jgi:hypothetical protein